MSPSDPWTVGRLLQWTQKYLSEHESESPRLEAEILLAHARGCQRIQLYTAFDEVPSEEIRTTFRELVRRRAEGMPVAYLVGRREFYSLSFRVTPDVLVPRPETEFVVVHVLDQLKTLPAGSPVRIADLGTGSGIIAIAIARQAPQVTVDAVDQSAAAIAIARANAADHKLAERIHLHEGDWLAPLVGQDPYDFIVSNPPYVATAEWEALPADVRNYEPRGALDAGPRGTEAYERLVPEAAVRLKPRGQLVLEIGATQEDAVRGLIEANGAYELLPTIHDLAGLPRVIAARRKG